MGKVKGGKEMEKIKSERKWDRETESERRWEKIIRCFWKQQENEKKSEAHIRPQDYKSHVSKAVQLKDSSACHLLGKLFTLHSGTNMNIIHMLKGLYTRQLYDSNTFSSSSTTAHCKKKKKNYYNTGVYWFLLHAIDSNDLHVAHTADIFHIITLRIFFSNNCILVWTDLNMLPYYRSYLWSLEEWSEESCL